MAIIATARESQTFPPAPEGMHQGVCVDVIDRGMVESTWNGKPKTQRKIDIAWQIREKRDDGKWFVVYKRYTLSLSEKATLRHDLESWRGRPFTETELKGFDVETVKGANALINVQHHTKGDRTYANVMTVSPLMRGMTKIVGEGYERPQPQQDPPPFDDDLRGVDEDPIPF